MCNRNIEYRRNCNHTVLSLRHERGRAFEVPQEIQFLQLAHKTGTRDEQYVMRMSIVLLSLCASNRVAQAGAHTSLCLGVLSQCRCSVVLSLPLSIFAAPAPSQTQPPKALPLHRQTASSAAATSRVPLAVHIAQHNTMNH